ncbi:MAG: hypothetical protein WBL79_08305 [Bacillota bacterium]|nr:hypothetical protein [Bacillota bacterium]
MSNKKTGTIVATAALAAIMLLASIGVSASAADIFAGWSEPMLWEHSGGDTERMPYLAGNDLYFAKDYDIYWSTFDETTGKWSEPEPVPGPINTAANEACPCVVGNGKVLYFSRYDPITDYDFYRSEWDEEKAEWGEPELIEELSTDGQDWAIHVNEDETIAYVISKIPYDEATVVGGRDIWKSVKVDGVWQTPVNLGEPLNSKGEEWSIFVDYMGRFWIDGNRADSLGNFDIYVAENEKATPINLGAPINTDVAEREPTINEKFFFFSANKREGGHGGWDLWYMVRLP